MNLKSSRNAAHHLKLHSEVDVTKHYDYPQEDANHNILTLLQRCANSQQLASEEQQARNARKFIAVQANGIDTFNHIARLCSSHLLPYSCIE